MSSVKINIWILPGFCSAAPKATAAKAVLAEITVKQVKIKEFIMMQGDEEY